MNIKRQFFMAKLGGQTRPFKFGTNTTQLYCEIRDCDLAQFREDFKTENVLENKVKPGCFRDLIWAALMDGQRFTKRQLDPDYKIDYFTNEHVGDWLDEMTDEDQQDFSDKYVKVIAVDIIEILSQMEKKLKEEQESGKKKSSGKQYLRRLLGRLV